MKRNYINLSDKQLRLIITNLQNSFEEDNIVIHDDNELFEHSTTNVIDSVLKYFGIKFGIFTHDFHGDSFGDQSCYSDGERKESDGYVEWNR
jgi:hypothetical protein